jgi:hypothetical protein
VPLTRQQYSGPQAHRQYDIFRRKRYTCEYNTRSLQIGAKSRLISRICSPSKNMTINRQAGNYMAHWGRFTHQALSGLPASRKHAGEPK